MKIRIRGNSVRYRLTRTDIRNMATIGFVEEMTEFPGGTVFRYRLQKKVGIGQMEASYTDNEVCICLPEELVREWTETEKVGYAHRVDLGNGKELSLLVEKDFACLDHTTEDQSDNYPNPNKTC